MCLLDIFGSQKDLVFDIVCSLFFFGLFLKKKQVIEDAWLILTRPEVTETIHWSGDPRQV